MLSILLKRKAQQQKATQVPTQVAVSTAAVKIADKPWEETQAMLKQDLAFLRTLAGSHEKDPFKAELVKKYQPVVEKLLSTHGNLENLDVIWWFYQWQIDLGKLPEVHDQLREAIDKGLETPTSWKVNGQTGYCDIVFKYSFKAHEQKKEFNRDYLTQAVSDLLDGTLATNAPLKVKMFRLVGDWHFNAGEKKQAYELFDAVMKLDPSKGGRKGKLNQLKEELGYGDTD